MNSVVEDARQAHEEIDLYEQALATIFLQPDTTHKHKLEKEHRASDILDRIVARKQTLKEHYADASGLRSTEIAALSAPPPPADDLEEFYARLVNIKEFHRKNPEVDSRAVENEIKGLVDGRQAQQDEEEDEFAVDPISSMFSGEENMGRFLDLYSYHSDYVNCKDVPQSLPYLAFLDLLAKGKVDAHVTKKFKGSDVYLKYVSGLHSYLLSFLSRTRPLHDVTAQEAEAEERFAALWDEGKLEGWEEEKEESQGDKKAGEGIWCPACQKMYSKQTVYDAHLKSKKHEKAAARLTATPSHSTANADASSSSAAPPPPSSLSALRHAKLRNPALLTYLTRALLISPLFTITLSDTRANVERRSALTARERELELSEPANELAPVADDGADPAAEGGEDDDDEKIYNPLKLPLGWDGKPIPYWLYKLHGLGVEYRCEICSDYAYMGRKNFERHFQESRHAFGMRALGLPNTKHFHEITKIEDALALAERLKQEGKQDARTVDTMEEIEDSEGNVYDKRTYEDLKRQGLLS